MLGESELEMNTFCISKKKFVILQCKFTQSKKSIKQLEKEIKLQYFPSRIS